MSAYHVLSTVGIFHNSLFLKVCKYLANEKPVRSNHESPIAKMHENSLFLYRSAGNGTYTRFARLIDFFNLGCLGMLGHTGMLIWLYPIVVNTVVTY